MGEWHRKRRTRSWHKNKQLAKMREQDKPLRKDPKELDPRVVQKVIQSGLPKSQKKEGPPPKNKKVVHKVKGWKFPFGSPVQKDPPAAKASTPKASAAASRL